MSPQEELAALRRLAELEAKAGGAGPMAQAAQPTARAGSGFTDNTKDRWGAGESAVTGAWQGLGDELMAGISAVKEGIRHDGLPMGKAYDQALSVYRSARDKYREESPGTALLTEGAGSLATGIPAAMLTGGAVNPASNTAVRMGQYAASGAVPSAVYGYNEGEGGAGERLKNAGITGTIGAATGMAVPAVVSGVGRVVQPVQSRLSDELSRLAQVARDNGIPLTAAQQTGSKPLQIMESVFGNLPFTAGPRQAQQQAQRAAFNRAVLAKAGVDADNASPEVMRQAYARLGGEFDRLADGNTVKLDGQFVDDLSRIRSDIARDLEPDQAAIVNRYLDDLMGGGGGGHHAPAGRGVARPGTTEQVVRVEQTPSGPVNIVEDVPSYRDITGRDYQDWRSAMTTRATKAANDPALRDALKAPRDALDDAATRSISPEDATAWDAARRQYANLKTVEKAMTGTTAASNSGDIPATALERAVIQQQGNKGFTTGRGDLNDLSRAGAAFVRDNIPDSGTAQRLFYQQLLTGGAGGLGYVSTDDPALQAASVALSLGGPRAVQMAYNSAPVRNYLTNTAVTGAISDQARRSLARMLAQGGGTVGGIQSQRP